MKRIVKSVLGTVVIIVVVSAILALSNVIALIPVEMILAFAYSNRWGIIGGLLLSYAGIAITEIFGKRRIFRRFQWNEKDDD